MNDQNKECDYHRNVPSALPCGECEACKNPQMTEEYARKYLNLNWVELK
jgi:hypothetical protein